MKQATRDNLARVFRLAAQLIERDQNCQRGACAAIRRAQLVLGLLTGYNTAYNTTAHRLFARYYPWGKHAASGGIDFGFYRESMDLRVIALCFCAAIVESE